MRIVLDTNIWISGLLLPNSKAGAIIKSWREGRFNIVVSAFILQEIERVLHYPKIAKRLNWDKEKVKNYIELLSFFAESIELKAIQVEVLKDPDDSPILATLLESQADWLITGDKVLLELKNKYPIITLEDFLKIH